MICSEDGILGVIEQGIQFIALCNMLWCQFLMNRTLYCLFISQQNLHLCLSWNKKILRPVYFGKIFCFHYSFSLLLAKISLYFHFVLCFQRFIIKREYVKHFLKPSSPLIELHCGLIWCVFEFNVVFLHCIGEEPIELLAEPCAINSFDIDRHNPSVSGGSQYCLYYYYEEKIDGIFQLIFFIIKKQIKFISDGLLLDCYAGCDMQFRMGSSSHIDKTITFGVSTFWWLEFQKVCN